MNVDTLKTLFESAYKEMLKIILQNPNTENDIAVKLHYGNLVVSKSCTYAKLSVNEEHLLSCQTDDYIAYRISITGIIQEHHKQLTRRVVMGSPVPVEEDSVIPLPTVFWIKRGVGVFRQQHMHKRLNEMEHSFKDIPSLIAWINSIYDVDKNTFRFPEENHEFADPLIYRRQRTHLFTKYPSD